MTYTGDVSVGGPSDTRQIGGVTLTKIAVGEMHNNAYLLVDESGQGLLIDAAAEPPRLLEMIGDTPVVKIVTTHQHPDHWQALAEVKAATGAVTVAHPADAPGIPVPTDELVEDGDTIEFGDTRLHVTHLVGHTPGSIALTLNAAGPAAAPVHRGLPVPRRSWEDNTPGRLQQPDGRPGRAHLRPAARRDLGLPWARQRLHPRRGAPAPGGMARPRLVVGRERIRLRARVLLRDGHR